MKKCLLIIEISALLAGCVKVVEPHYADYAEETVKVSFEVPVAGTRAIVPFPEDRIESLQVFVFDPLGQIQNYGTSEGNSLDLTCTTGQKTFSALVNAPSCTGIKSLEELRSMNSDFRDNSPGAFVMSGSLEEVLTASGSVDITVRRLVSKVVLNKVRNELRFQQHREMDFVVTSVYLTDVPDGRMYFGNMSSPDRIASGCPQEESQESYISLLYDDLEDAAVRYGEAVSFGNFLYCYPRVDASEKPAYLVVEAILGDSRYYYPVALPQMESNKCYSVSLTVTGPGSLSPDIPVERTEAAISVYVSDWDEYIDVNETI